MSPTATWRLDCVDEHSHANVKEGAGKTPYSLKFGLPHERWARLG